MAAAKIEGEKSRGSMVGMLLIMTLLTVLSAGVGFVAGHQLKLGLAPPVAGTAKLVAPLPPVREGQQLISLPTIITNLAGEPAAWLRLEASISVAGDKPVAATLVAQFAEDATALLRTLTVQQIAGASGFQHLHEELLDRMRARSADKVQGILIRSLVIE